MYHVRDSLWRAVERKFCCSFVMLEAGQIDLRENGSSVSDRKDKVEINDLPKCRPDVSMGGGIVVAIAKGKA